MKVLVWNDESDVAIRWRDDIDELLKSEKVIVHASTLHEIQDELKILHRRRLNYLGSDNHGMKEEKIELDSTDILFVHSDLFKLPEFRDYTAEMVATRAGVYSDCAYFVIVNLTPAIDFDLTLIGHPDSKADLHINARFISSCSLWNGRSENPDQFKPWHWPLLKSASEANKARVKDLLNLLNENPGKPIVEHLEIPPQAQCRLSRNARAFLHPQRKHIEEISFWDLINENDRVVSSKEGALICTRKDVKTLSRVAARRISKWLARLVLGPQNVLVDLPHVVDKFPFVVPISNSESIEYWNSYADLVQPSTRDVKTSMEVEAFESVWTDRPAFWAHEINTEANIERLFNSRDSNPLDVVFCEDTSTFQRASLCDRFVAAHGSISDDRFIQGVEDSTPAIKYGPQSRLVM